MPPSSYQPSLSSFSSPFLFLLSLVSIRLSLLIQLEALPALLPGRLDKLGIVQGLFLPFDRFGEVSCLCVSSSQCLKEFRISPTRQFASPGGRLDRLLTVPDLCLRAGCS